MTALALRFLEIYQEDFFKQEGGVIKALLICFVAILIVFLVLVVIIFAIKAMQLCFSNKKVETVQQKNETIPFVSKAEKKNTEIEDDDMMVAALIATIDFASETKEDVRLVSIKRIG